MADKFGGQKDGRQTTGATFYDVPAVPVNANTLYFPNFPASPFFGVAEYPVAAGDLGAFSTSGVFVFDKPIGWIDNPGRKVFYRPKTAATGEIVAQEVKGDVFVGYQVVDNINPQKLGVLLASPEFCMNVLIVTSTADSGAGSLRQAIAGASDGDVILFDADVFPAGQTTSILLSSYITVNKSISIYGGFNDGAGGYTSGATKRYYVYRDVEGVKTKVYITDETPAQNGETVLFENVCRIALDGQNAVRQLYLGNGTRIISGIAFDNGGGSTGGAIYFINAGQNTINDCDFYSCGGSSGGAFYSYHTSVNTLNDCSIRSCSATNYGGACTTSLTSQNTLNKCAFDSCNSASGGACVFSSGSQNILNDCIFYGCSATNNGGAFYSSDTSQNTLNNCDINNCSAGNYGGGLYSTITSQVALNNCSILNNTSTDIKRSDVVIGDSSVLKSNNAFIGYLITGVNADASILNGITTVRTATFNAATININDGAALTITDSATIGAATFTSEGRGYLAVAAGIDISSATLTGVVACTYGAGLESFEISADGASWTAQDLTTPILIETRDAGGVWQTLTDDATGGEYATTFALESTARAFDGVAFFVATLPGYWQADAGAVDANDWSVKGFAATNSNGGGDAQGDAAQGWTVTPSTVTPNADGV